MSFSELKEINLDPILTNKKWVVTWKGNAIDRRQLDVSQYTKNSSKRAAIALEHLINRDGMKCVKCGRMDYLTIDHIVPVAFLQDIGLSREETYQDWENLQLLCKLCNGFKGPRLDFSNPKTKVLLLKYIASVPDTPSV